MCGRYLVAVSARKIAETFGAEVDTDLEMRPATTWRRRDGAGAGAAAGASLVNDANVS